MDTARRAVELRRVARSAFGWDELRPGSAGGHGGGRHRPGHARGDAHRTRQVGDLPGADRAARPPHGRRVPLISLQRDQVSGIEAAPAAPPAGAVNSAQSQEKTERTWDRWRRAGGYLFLSPEQLADPDVVERVKAVEPALLVIDEAQ